MVTTAYSVIVRLWLYFWQSLMKKKYVGLQPYLVAYMQLFENVTISLTTLVSYTNALPDQRSRRRKNKTGLKH